MHYNITFSINREYLLFCMVTLYSLLKNNKDYHFNIYILHNNCLSELEIENICIKYPLNQFSNFKIKLVDVSSLHLLQDKKYIMRDNYCWEKEILFKLFLSELLPNVDKVLHLDTDVIIRGDIAKLLDISEICLYKGSIAIKTNDWLNAGVLVINLKLARERKIHEIIIPYLKKNNHTEEEVINILFKDKIEFYDIELVINLQETIAQTKKTNEHDYIAVHYIMPKPFILDSSFFYIKSYIFEYFSYFKDFIDKKYRLYVEILVFISPVITTYYSYKRRCNYLIRKLQGKEKIRSSNFSIIQKKTNYFITQRFYKYAIIGKQSDLTKN